MKKAFYFFLPYSLPYLLSLATCFGYFWGQTGFYWGLFFFFVLHPGIDYLFRNKRIPADRPPSQFWRDLYLYASLPFVSLVLLLGMYISRGLHPYEMIGLILSTGTIMGVLGINIAHELIHRKHRISRASGVYLLSLCNFAHWGVTHVFGHHKNVATPQDSATARKDETVYQFWMRSFFSGYRESLNLEKNRCRDKKFANRIFHYILIQIGLFAFVFLTFGPAALLFWLGQSLVAIALLLTVDYVEHYGLQRQLNPQTRMYEGFKPQHAWDSYQAYTNYALMNLAHHSHHHLKAQLPYSELQEQKEAQHLPAGYSVMAILALVPPVFFKIMNPRLNQDPK